MLCYTPAMEERRKKKKEKKKPTIQNVEHEREENAAGGGRRGEHSESAMVQSDADRLLRQGFVVQQVLSGDDGAWCHRGEEKTHRLLRLCLFLLCPRACALYIKRNLDILANNPMPHISPTNAHLLTALKKQLKTRAIQ